jgi:hypothetical protein
MWCDQYVGLIPESRGGRKRLLGKYIQSSASERTIFEALKDLLPDSSYRARNYTSMPPGFLGIEIQAVKMPSVSAARQDKDHMIGVKGSSSIISKRDHATLNAGITPEAHYFALDRSNSYPESFPAVSAID